MTEELPFLNNPSYKWIFVGGKGGVGKTTTACSIALALSKYRRNVLLVSTDPASNIGDAFQQHFTSQPQLVQGTTNLYAKESQGMEQLTGTDAGNSLGSALEIPGIDEAATMLSLFSSIESEVYDVVVFDTAPTGHTMRLLQMAGNTKSIFSKLGQFAPTALNAASTLFGVSGGTDDMTANLNKMQKMTEKVQARLTNPMETTFVCVLIPEILPVYETERLVYFLANQNIESHVIIVNQCLRKEKAEHCPYCSKKLVNQQKQLEFIDETYDDYVVVKIEMQEEEIKGLKRLSEFSEQFSCLFKK